MNHKLKTSMGADGVVNLAELDRAQRLYEEIKSAKRSAGVQFLNLGKALTIINNEDLYLYFDCESFNEFIAMPELGFSRSTAYSFMRVYDTFIEQCQMDPARISNVDITKLNLIAPVIEIHPEMKEDWLSRAETLSTFDLRNEVREWQGKEIIIDYNRRRQESPVFQASYVEYVQSHPCIICGNGTVDCHHFPRTRGAGADDTHVIPLCRVCHASCHQNPNNFLLANTEAIFKYFYDTFGKAFAIIHSHSYRTT